MTLREYATMRVNEVIEQEGSLRKAARKIGMDPSVMSKIKNGIYYPNCKTLAKYFPDIEHSLFDDVHEIIQIQTNPIIVQCDDLEALKKQLDALGYEMHIEFKKKKAV